MRLVAKRINIRHQLITQPQILLQDRLRLLPIRPDLVVPAAAMGTEIRLERPILKPPRIQLGVVIVPANVIPSIRRIEQRRMRRMMHRRQILPTANVIPPISNPRSRNIQPGRNLPPQRIPVGINIRRPENRAVMLRPRDTRRATESAPVRNIPPETVIERRGMKQRINIEVLRARPNLKSNRHWAEGPAPSHPPRSNQNLC